MAAEKRRLYRVTAKWDPIARLWLATSTEINGLVLNGPTQEALIEKLVAVVPSLLKHNEGKFEGGSLEINYVGRETVAIDDGKKAA
jgi:hypothetical protein